MTEVRAATLLQLRWRQLRAARLRSHWQKISVFEGAGKKKDAADAAGAPAEEGWELGTNKLSGARYLFHVASGKTKWV